MKTYKYQNKQLIKVPDHSKSACGGCFFEYNSKGCDSFVPTHASCFEGKDDNKEDMIFIELKESNTNEN